MAEVDRLRSVLLVGGPDTGKTHYGAQLLGRLQTGRGELHLRRAPQNIEPFKEALHRIGQGLLAAHTSLATYDEILLPLELSTGAPVDLIWPDYGGEQVRQMMEQRRIDERWEKRIRESSGWLLFIRPSLLHPQNDIFSRPIHNVVRPGEAVDNDRPWSQQAWFMELLQLLLFVRRAGTLDRVSKPRLAVVLSCWDEVTSGEDLEPADVLLEKLPLLLSFLRSVWDAQSMSIFGVSSLGRSLEEEGADEEYQDYGPETFGYAVSPQGARSDDLSLPIHWLLSGR